MLPLKCHHNEVRHKRSRKMENLTKYTAEDLVNGTANQSTQSKFEEFLQQFCEATGSDYDALTEEEKTEQAEDFLDNNLYA